MLRGGVQLVPCSVMYEQRSIQRNCTQALKMANPDESEAERKVWDELQKGGKQLFKERVEFAKHIEQNGFARDRDYPDRHPLTNRTEYNTIFIPQEQLNKFIEQSCSVASRKQPKRNRHLGTTNDGSRRLRASYHAPLKWISGDSQTQHTQTIDKEHTCHKSRTHKHKHTYAQTVCFPYPVHPEPPYPDCGRRRMHVLKIDYD